MKELLLTESGDGPWHLDCRDLLCPVPVIQAGRALRRLPQGAILRILADDPGAELDLRSWCSANRQELLDQRLDGAVWTTRIRKLR